MGKTNLGEHIQKNGQNQQKKKGKIESVNSKTINYFLYNYFNKI